MSDHPSAAAMEAAEALWRHLKIRLPFDEWVLGWSEEAHSAIAHALDAFRGGGWISVNYRLPDSVRVLVWLAGTIEGQFAFVADFVGDGWEVPGWGFLPLQAVTHWAEICPPIPFEQEVDTPDN